MNYSACVLSLQYTKKRKTQKMPVQPLLWDGIRNLQTNSRWDSNTMDEMYCPSPVFLFLFAFNSYLCGLLFASLALMKSHGHENSNTYFSGALSMKLARGTTELSFSVFLKNVFQAEKPK